MAAPQASSRLEMLQARFQQKQLQEKEQKLLQLYDQQQQRAYQVAQRASAGSNASNHGSSAQHTLTRTTSNIHTASNSQGGKVRQMFDERRQTTVKGIDRSYPLEPLDNKLRKQTSNGVVPSKNNVSRQTVSVKRVARADVNSNINAGKPIVSYHEEITRDTFGPQGHKQEIFEHDYDGENHVTRLSNGNLRDGSQLEFDETLKNRVRNDLESEQFPEDLMIDVPDKLPKKTGAARKLTQAEARLERFKNSAAKNPGLKSTGNALGVAKKRTETTGPAKSNTSEFKRSTSPFSTKWRTDVFPMRSSKTLGFREKSPREYGKLGGAAAAAAAAIQARDTSARGYGSRDFGSRSPSPKFLSETSRISSRTSSLDRKSLRSQSPEYAKLRDIRRQIRDVGTRSPSSGSRSSHEAFGGTSSFGRSPRSRSLEHTRTYQTRGARGTGGSRNAFAKSPSSTAQFTGDGPSSRITRISSLDGDSSRSASSGYTRLSKIRDIKIRNSGSKDAFATRSRSSSPGRSTATFSLAGKSPRSRSLDRLRSGINAKGTRSDDENSRQTDFGKQIAIRQVRPGLSDLSKKTTASFERKIRGVGLRQSDNSLNKPVGGSRVKRSPRPVTLESDIRVNKGLSPRINKDVEIFQPYALKRRSTSPRLRENYSTSYNLNGRFDGPRTLENDIFVNEGLEPTWDKDVEVFDPYVLRRQSTSPRLASKYSVDSGILSGPNQGLGRPRTLETDILVNLGLDPVRHRDVEAFGTHTQRKRSASPQLISKSRSRSWSPHFFRRECTKTGAASKLDDRSNRLVRDIIRKHRSKDSQLITPTESPVLHRRSSDLTVKSPSSRSGSLTALKDIPSEEIDRRYSSSVERSLRRSKSPILQKRDPYSEERIEFKSGKRSVSPSYHLSRVLGSSPRSFTSEVDTEIQEITMTDQFIDPRKYHGGKRSTVTLKTVPSRTYSTKGKRKVTGTSEGDRSFLRSATKTGGNKSFSLGLNIYGPLDTPGKRPISQLSTSSSNDDYRLRSKSLERVDCFKAGTDKSSRSRSSGSRSVSPERYKAAPFALHGKDEAFGSRYVEEPNKSILNSLIEDSKKNMRELQQTLAKKRREVSLLARKPKANIPFKSVLKKTPINNRLRGTAIKCRLGATSANDPSKLTRLIKSSPNCRRKLFSNADSNVAAEDRKSKRCTTCKERSGGGGDGGDQPAKTQAKHCSRKEPRSHLLDFALLGKGRGRGKSADSSRPGHLAINLNSRRRARSIDSRKTDDSRSIDPSASVKQLRSIENIRKSMSSPKLSVGRRISGKTAIANQIHGDFKSRRDDKQQRMMDSVLQTKKILSKIKSPGYRVTKSPSPDIALKKTESNPRASIRRSVPTSPSKSPDIIPRRATTDIRSQEARSTRRSGPGSSGDASTSKVSLGSVKGTDEVDAIMFRNDSSNGGFSENFHDQLKSKEKATIKKQTSEKQISSTTGRPPSSVSSISSASSMPGQTSGAKKGMASKAKLKAPPISSGRVASASMENLVPCKCCSRRFAPDRIKKHEEICAGTNQKKRKQFDSMKFRVRGTELEPFVKKGPHKKQPEKAKKLEVKSDWRRKHEDFINAIRSAKQVKAHLDAGGKLSDLPPPPPSDTSDYIQCPHCGRKFNQAAAERHIPKCVHMLHNKPAHSRAPQRLKR